MKRRLSTITLTAALVATACSGDADPQATPNTQAVPRVVQDVATTTTTVAPSTTTTTVLAPSTLAFGSSDDIGRLFALNRDITASTLAGGDPDASFVAAGTLIQSSSLRSSDDVLFVRIESTAPDGSTLGWVPADALSPTTESVFTEDPTSAREFRQVARAVENDQLGLLPNPGAGSALGFLAEGEVAMHGGVSALAPSGTTWVDVIDPASGTRLGWVPARSFPRLNGGVVQDDAGNTVGRSAVDDVSYGQSLVGAITASGCNAVQVTFTNASSSAGLGIVFGTDSPIGRRIGGDRLQWSGTSIYSEAGADVTLTIPTNNAQTWFFAPIDADGQAEFASFNEDDRAVANNVQPIEVPASSCVRQNPVVDSPAAAGPPEFDPYNLSLPPAEREAAIAAFEAELAEFEGGAVATEEDDPQAVEGENAEDAPAEDAATDEVAVEDAPVDETTEAPIDDATATDGAVDDVAGEAAPADETAEQPTE